MNSFSFTKYLSPYVQKINVNSLHSFCQLVVIYDSFFETVEKASYWMSVNGRNRP